MLRRVATLVAVLGLASGSAWAADLSVKAVPAAVSPTFDWTGWYAGIGGGYQAGTATGSGVTGVNIQPHLWFVGLEGGYRIQLPYNLVLGVDVGVPVWATTNTFVPAGVGTAVMKPRFIMAPEVQLGYAVGRLLPFVGLGVGFADIKGTITPLGGATFSDTELIPEYMITFGLDYAWTDHVIVGLRYDHIELDEHNWTFATAPIPTIAQVGGNSDGISGFVQYKF
jgi:outer membrane immunogenic protein